MKRGRKKKIVTPESVGQHIEEEFKRNKDFRKAYMDEAMKLEIAYKIMQLRKARGISQAELAKRMRTTQQNVSRLEDPRNTEFTISTLSRVALALRAHLNIDFTPQRSNSANIV